MSRYKTCDLCGRERLSEPFGMHSHLMKHYRDGLAKLGEPTPARNIDRRDLERLLMSAMRRAKGLVSTQ